MARKYLHPQHGLGMIWHHYVNNQAPLLWAEISTCLEPGLGPHFDFLEFVEALWKL